MVVHRISRRAEGLRSRTKLCGYSRAPGPLVSAASAVRGCGLIADPRVVTGLSQAGRAARWPFSSHGEGTLPPPGKGPQTLSSQNSDRWPHSYHLCETHRHPKQ